MVDFLLKTGLIERASHQDELIITDKGVLVGRLLFLLSLNEITFDLADAQALVSLAEENALDFYKEYIYTKEDETNN